MKKRISSTLSLALLIISAHAAYCPFNEYSWNNDKENNGVGKDETGMDWDTYMNTEEGRALKPHSGDYDVPEAYSWLKKVLIR